MPIDTNPHAAVLHRSHGSGQGLTMIQRNSLPIQGLNMVQRLSSPQAVPQVSRALDARRGQA